MSKKNKASTKIGTELFTSDKCESKNQCETVAPLRVINSLFAEEGIKNCDHQCKTCSLTESQSCKELSLAMLCYLKEIISKRLTVQEADRQLRSNFPKMSFPAFEDDYVIS